MGQYKAATGLTASMQAGVLTVQWAGGDGAELRTRYSVAGGTPVVRELAVRKTGGSWSTLGENLKPEYRVVSGIRRFSSQQGEPLQGIGQLTPERAEKEKWYAYRDAPLYMGPPSGPGGPGGPLVPEGVAVPGRRRCDPDDGASGWRPRRRGWCAGGPPFLTIAEARRYRRASSSFKTTSCSVRDGRGAHRGHVQRPVDGHFLQVCSSLHVAPTSFAWTRGLDQRALGGLQVRRRSDGFLTTKLSRLAWNNIAGHPSQYEFGAPTNQVPVVVRSDNRVIVAEGPGGSLAAFPMPHQAFWPRQHFINLGYSWYRKDADASFSFGVRQAEEEEVNNFTTFELINAPPGTMQRMGIYFYASPLSAEPTRQAVLAFTHNDTFKPVAGYKTMVNHMHSTVKNQVMAQKTPELGGCRGAQGDQRQHRRRPNAETTSRVSLTTPGPWRHSPTRTSSCHDDRANNSVIGTRSGRRACCGTEAAHGIVPFSAIHPQLQHYNVGSTTDMQC
jgi:hypothetical protein